MSAQENRDLVKKYFDAVNEGNLDVVDEVFETNYSHHDPANPDPNGVGSVEDVHVEGDVAGVHTGRHGRGPGGERRDVVDDLGHHEVGAGIELRL